MYIVRTLLRIFLTLQQIPLRVVIKVNIFKLKTKYLDRIMINVMKLKKTTVVFVIFHEVYVHIYMYIFFLNQFQREMMQLYLFYITYKTYIHVYILLQT